MPIDIEKESSQYYQAFPKKLGRFFVIDIIDLNSKDFDLVYASPNAVSSLTGNVHVTKAQLEALPEVEGIAALGKFKLKNLELGPGCVFVRPGYHVPHLTSLKEDKEWSFDSIAYLKSKDPKVYEHEMGHLLVEGGINFTEDEYQGYKAESKAETFAYLRKCQTRDYPFVEFEKDNGSGLMVSGASPMYYSYPVITAVEYLYQQYDLSVLAIEDTAVLANHIVESFCLSEEEYYSVKEVFNPLAEEFSAKKVSERALRRVGFSTIFNNHNRHAYRAGRAFLSQPLMASFVGEKVLSQDRIWDTITFIMQALEEAGIEANHAMAIEKEQPERVEHVKSFLQPYKRLGY